MERRRIGSLEVSAVGIGCNNFGSRIDESRTAQVVHAALDAGINFFDTADIYGRGASEEFLGRALGARRSEVIIATKFGHTFEGQGEGASPAYIRTAVETSLRRLGTDYIDLYQLHTPDPTVPIAETLGALDELVRAGKVREIGCSNFSADALSEAEDVVAADAARFVSVQNQYSLFHREPEQGGVLAECERHDIAFLPYFPLASGLLTGKYRKGEPMPEGTRITNNARYATLVTDQNLDRVERLIAYAESKGHTLLELAFSWLLAHAPVASVIAGATSDEQVRLNAAAAGWSMTPEDLAAIDEIVPAELPAQP